MVSEPETGWLLIQCDWSERQGDAEPDAPAAEPGVVSRVVARLAGYARAAHGAATRKAASRSSRSL